MPQRHHYLGDGFCQLLALLGSDGDLAKQLNGFYLRS